MLASPEDVAARLRRELTEHESNWIEGLLAESSAEVVEFCRQSFDPVPDTVRIVTSRVAARALEAPAVGGLGSRTEQAGPVQLVSAFTADASSGGVYLSGSDKRKLLAYRRVRGAFTVDLTPP